MRDGILVVGGAAGIGAAVADWFRPDSVVWSRREGGVDATDPESVAPAAERYLREHGAPFGVVHTVGDFDERPLLATDDRLYRHLLDSNLTSAFLVARALVPSMVAAGRGRVIFCSAAGAADPRAHPRSPLYFAAKAALVSMARSLAMEVAASGVTVNVVAPGVIRHAHSHAASQDRVESEVPLRRPGVVDDLRGVFELLLGAGGAYVTGEEITVDGGLRMRMVEGADPIEE